MEQYGLTKVEQNRHHVQKEDNGVADCLIQIYQPDGRLYDLKGVTTVYFQKCWRLEKA